jgi:hypothetical protein
VYAKGERAFPEQNTPVFSPFYATKANTLLVQESICFIEQPRRVFREKKIFLSPLAFGRGLRKSTAWIKFK